MFRSQARTCRSSSAGSSRKAAPARTFTFRLDDGDGRVLEIEADLQDGGPRAMFAHTLIDAIAHARLPESRLAR
jgi:hypothetical protein